MLRLSDIKINIDKAASGSREKEALKQAIITRLNIKEQELENYSIYRQSIDARKKSAIFFVYTLDVSLKNESKLFNRSSLKGVTFTPEETCQPVQTGSSKMKNRPVIVGMGPAGLFAGLFLARNGYRPVILERGEDVDSRTERISQFWHSGRLDTECNVQFGEGGAGTFSDGKLTTLINDPRCRYVLQEFIHAGAPPEILYKSKPHIGTDKLASTVKNIRQQIISCGGEVRFKAKVTDFILENDQIRAVEINNEEKFDCQILLLAIGHSARDTYEVLHRRGVAMSPKAFSIGVRIEHPQTVIDRAQYGNYAGHTALGAADYKLAYHSHSGRSAYTFCMCPGGYVVAAASEAGGVVTNGMSEFSRNSENANSALLVGVTPDDFPSRHPLAGIEFQRKWERLAFKLGGENYLAPVQLTGDFLQNRESPGTGQVKPTYKPGITFAPLQQCLPDYITATMKEAIPYFDQRLRGFAMEDSVMTGVETRSSSPVRINRDEMGMANIRGLYPMGEGAGYAGGIMSSAVDGLKAAEKVIRQFAPPRGSKS